VPFGATRDRGREEGKNDNHKVQRVEKEKKSGRGLGLELREHHQHQGACVGRKKKRKWGGKEMYEKPGRTEGVGGKKRRNCRFLPGGGSNDLRSQRGEGVGMDFHWISSQEEQTIQRPGGGGQGKGRNSHHQGFPHATSILSNYCNSLGKGLQRG